MAVSYLKVQMEFRMGSDGWSEHIYMAGSTPRSAVVKANELVTQRRKILANVGYIHHVRISPANEKTIRSYRFPVLNGQGQSTAARDVANVTRTCGLYGAAGERRTYFTHGRVDDANTFDAAGVADTSFTTAGKDWWDYLAGIGYPGDSNGWMLRHRVQGAKDLTLKTVADIQVVGNYVVFYLDTTALSNGDQITISGADGFHASQFNGTWKVAGKNVVAANTIKVSTRRFIDPRFYYIPESGKIRAGGAAGFTYVLITSHDAFEQPGTRKTGRPSDEHRGRQSGRR